MAKRKISKSGGGKIKGVDPLKSSEREFASAMEYMVDFMTRFIRNNVIGELQQSTVEKFADAKQVGNYANIFLTLNKRAQRKLLKRFDDKRLEKLSRKVLNKVNRRNAQQFYGGVEDAIGTSAKELLNSEGLQANINALILETSQWAKKLRDETLEAYTANTLRVMAQGGSLTDVLEQYDGMEEKRKNHAKMVARTQVANFNSLVSKARAENLGIQKARWITSRDERVRKCHQVRDKKEFDMSKGLYSSRDGKWLLPGTDFNCFEGSTKIDHSSSCLKLYRRIYTGELTELVFDDGVIYRSTPNHPIFTVDGFKGAGSVNVGEYIVGTSKQCADRVELNSNNMKPTFEQLFSSIKLFGVEHSVSPAVSGKFHGDVSDGEIEIVSFDSFLMRKADASIVQKFAKLKLSLADQMIVFKALTCNSKISSRFDCSGLSSASIMGILNLVRSGFLVHLTPLELFRFALGSWADPIVDKALSYNRSTNTEVFSDCVFAYTVAVHGLNAFDIKIESFMASLNSGNNTPLFKLPVDGGIAKSDLISGSLKAKSGFYKTRRVVDKRSIDFSGHIYNLETVSNDYIAHSTAVSNCRCTYEFILPDEE